jgi:hypothetical protein
LRYCQTKDIDPRIDDNVSQKIQNLNNTKKYNMGSSRVFEDTNDIMNTPRIAFMRETELTVPSIITDRPTIAPTN